MVLAPTMTLNGSYGLATVDYNAVVVSGAGNAAVNGIYTITGESAGRPYYNLPSYSNADQGAISWSGDTWYIWGDFAATEYASTDDVEFPWQIANWTSEDSGPPFPTVNGATV